MHHGTIGLYGNDSRQVVEVALIQYIGVFNPALIVIPIPNHIGFIHFGRLIVIPFSYYIGVIAFRHRSILLAYCIVIIGDFCSGKIVVLIAVCIAGNAVINPGLVRETLASDVGVVNTGDVVVALAQRGVVRG
jgi:hypothetical protein